MYQPIPVIKQCTNSSPSHTTTVAGDYQGRGWEVEFHPEWERGFWDTLILRRVRPRSPPGTYLRRDSDEIPTHQRDCPQTRRNSRRSEAGSLPLTASCS